MKTTKEQAKQEVAIYSELLADRGIISDITSEEVRNQMKYSFLVYDNSYAYQQECVGLVELSKILGCMWSAYARARVDMGLDA